jgi:hypothetical protein
MDIDRFDAILRSLSHLPSRRDVLRGFVGAGLGLGSLQVDDVGAKKKHHKKHKDHQAQSPPPQSPPSQSSPPQGPPSPTCTPHCGRKRCGDDGCGGSCGSCAAGQFCRTGTCCTPKAKDVICTVNCGINAPCPSRCDAVTSIGTCGQPVACSCPSGQVCLSNGGCGQVCRDFNDCPGPFSNCFNCDPSTEGEKHCTANTPSCSEPACTSTADCPVGTHCQVTNCGPNGNEKRCVNLSFCPG